MDKVFGVIRHLITAAGAVLVGLGISDAGQIANLTGNIETIIGAAGVVIGIVSSIVVKLKSWKLFGAAGGDANE